MACMLTGTAFIFKSHYNSRPNLSFATVKID